MSLNLRCVRPCCEGHRRGGGADDWARLVIMEVNRPVSPLSCASNANDTSPPSSP